jgi:hypothetical protein
MLAKIDEFAKTLSRATNKRMYEHKNMSTQIQNQEMHNHTMTHPSDHVSIVVV